MCSNDSSDLIQELWTKYLNCSFKNKSETLMTFLKSVYCNSIKGQNRLDSIFLINDTSGMLRFLIREFLNDLESVCNDNDDVDKELNDVKCLRQYLEGERGTLVLYGIDTVLDQIISAKENRIESVRSSVIKMINDAELCNILATTLISVLSLIDKDDDNDQASAEMVILPNSTLSHNFYEQLHRSSLSKKSQPHHFSVAKLSERKDFSSDENDQKKYIKKIRPKFKDKNASKPKSSFLVKNNDTFTITKVYEFSPQTDTELNELFQVDMPEVETNENTNTAIGTLRCGNVVTTLRIVTRLLGNIIFFDSTLCKNAISIHLETFNLCCQFLGERDVPFNFNSQELINLAEELLYNIGIIMRLLFVERNSDQTSVSLLLGHKIIERLLLAYGFLAPKRGSFLSLILDLNQLITYIFIIVARKVLSTGSQAVRCILQLFTSWHINDGTSLILWTLNEEVSLTIQRKTKTTLFAQLCTLLSLLNDFKLEKGIRSISGINQGDFSHHSDKFNLIPTINRQETTDTCCYAMICELLLSNLFELLTKDSDVTYIESYKKRFYQEILTCIKSVRFCCSINILSYSNQLLSLLVNQKSATVKAIILRFLQILIEVSFEFYKSKDSCECQYTPRHDISLILQGISNACIPIPKDSLCPRPHYATTPEDLLHFFDWIARRHNDRMKSLVVDVVVLPLFKRLQLYSVYEVSHQYHLIAAALLSLMPYLNCQWQDDELLLVGEVCAKNPILQSTFYKCLTVAMFSTKPESSLITKEPEIKTRIIKFLLSRVNFTSLIHSFNTESFTSEKLISTIIKDTEIWYCYRLLFTYNEEFRRTMFEQGGIDCCYIILKQVIQYISQIKGENLQDLDKSAFMVFESLMCLVVDGNMLKSSYYYEGFSCEVIWTQLQNVILNNFSSNKTKAKLFLSSFFNCCFRQKWGIQDGLYQLRQMFLESIFNASQSVSDDDLDNKIDDFEESSNSSKRDSSSDDINYEADVSSGVSSLDEGIIQTNKTKKYLQLSVQRSVILLHSGEFDDAHGNLEINGTLMELLMKILLTYKLEDHDSFEEIFESIYNVVRTLSDISQRHLLSDAFFESMSNNIDDVLGRPNKFGLKLALLKLIILPCSSWCTSKRLLVIIRISKIYEDLTAHILPMLTEKASLIQTFQPETSIILPVNKADLGMKYLSFMNLISDSENTFDYMVHSPLTDGLWKSLNPEYSTEEGGFSVCMWLQMNVISPSGYKKKNTDYRKNKKKFAKQSTIDKKSMIPNDSNGMSISEDQSLVHIITLYSREKVTFNKLLSVQIWCMPYCGTVIVRLYERIENVFVTSPVNTTKPKEKPGIGAMIANMFTNLSGSNNNDSDPYVVVESPNSTNSFSLIDEAIIHGFVSSNIWNFFTVTVNWASVKVATVTLLLNGEIIRQVKLHHHRSRVLRYSNPLECFVAIGHSTSSPSTIQKQHCYLGNIFLFEDPIITCGNDNLSLMLLTPNWDGGQVTFNNSQDDSYKLLATVVIRLLVDRQIYPEYAALLLERGYNLLSNDWLSKISEYITSNLIGTYTNEDPWLFKTNAAYRGESILTVSTDSPIWLSINKEDKCDHPHQNFLLSKNTLDSAFENLGGTSVLYFWLAKIVEKEDLISCSHLIKLLFILLKKSIILAFQNMQESGYSILFQLFKSFKMDITLNMIKEVISHAVYEGFNSCKATLKATSNSKLCRDPYLLRELLLQWKMWATSKVSASESGTKLDLAQCLENDKYLLSQINNLLKEENVYSNINCASFGYAGILHPLLLACQEPFDTLPNPLPSEICQLIIHIISNFIPTPADLSTVTLLCNTILHLYQVSMKDGEIESGKYFRTLRSYTKFDFEILSDDRSPKSCSRSPCPTERPFLQVEQFSNLVNNKPQVTTAPCNCPISDVEIRAMTKFYGDTLSLEEIEKSADSGTSDSSVVITLINDEDEASAVETSFESNDPNCGIIEATLVDGPYMGNTSHSSRIDILAGLISTLENVILVKISDTILVQLSCQNFCFEFIIHLLTHPSATVRQKGLSLFRVYICERKSLTQAASQQPQMLNTVSYIIHQNSSSAEVVAETVSIIFGQNITALICEIDWENSSVDDTDYPKRGKPEVDPLESLPLRDSKSKLSGIVSVNVKETNSLGDFETMVKDGGNHMGLSYFRSSVLLLSTLSNMEWSCMVTMLRFCDWLFFENPVLLQAALKSGLMECLCNVCHQFSISAINKENRAFQALLSICVTISTDLTTTASYPQFIRLLEMCEILYFAGVKMASRLLEKGKDILDVLQLCMVGTIIVTSIKTICILNNKDTVFRISFDDQSLLLRIHRLPEYYNMEVTTLSKKLIKTINTATNMVINTEEDLLPLVLDLYRFLGLKLVNLNSKIISNCLACNVIPDHFSLFYSVKESIKSNLGDLIIFMTNPKLDISFRMELLCDLVKLDNVQRVTRYSLLGNSSGSMCLILNLKNITKVVKGSGDFESSVIRNIEALLEVICLDFDVEIIREDNRNLWIQHCNQKLADWKQNFGEVISAWNMNAERSHSEILVYLKKYQNNYRLHARKNLQDQNIAIIRKQRSAEFYRRRTWKTLITNFTQEKAIWGNDDVSESQFMRLDGTEGPCRIRRRMTKSTLNLKKSFFKPELNLSESNSSQKLDFLFNSTYSIDRMVFESPIKYQLLKCIEDVRLSCSCAWVSQSGTFDGEFFVGKSRMGFMVDNVNISQSCYDQIPNSLKDYGFISWRLNEIEWVLKRRFKLRDLALEVFMKDGRNCLIAAKTTQDRDAVLSCIESFLPPAANVKPRLIEIQSKWLTGEMTNFDYLTILNTASGRSYNDIMQYPVFPFILANYSSNILNLEAESTFRDLSNPITVQSETLRERVAKNFAEKAEEYQRQLNIARFADDFEDMPIWAVPPHHYSSMYSNSATVLYYMIRVPPFTQKFIEFQDHQFDRPDRLFHTLESAWELSTSSITCVKEIIPEFFFLPEMFLNSQNFNFGERSNGLLVDDVILPKWCQGDARHFCLIHRVALESSKVSAKLNMWVDLIFGYKQTGKLALDAMNLFHPYSYFKAISPDDIKEPLRRRAVEQMIENYGQIPKQLFLNRPHASKKPVHRPPKSENVIRQPSLADIGKVSSESSDDPETAFLQKDRSSISVLSNIIGIPWGNWVGSPQNSQTYLNIVSDINYPGADTFYLPPKSKYNIKSNKMIILPKGSDVLFLSTADDDILPLIQFSSIYLKKRVKVTSISVSHSYNLDYIPEYHGSFFVSVASGMSSVSCIAVYQRSGRIFFGMYSGLIEVFQGDVNKHSQIEPFIHNFTKHWRTLSGHRSCVTHMNIGESFAVLASCDNRTNIAIWDPQRLDLMYYIDWSLVTLSASLDKPNLPNNDINRKSNSSFESMLTAMCFSETLGDLIISRTVYKKTTNIVPMSNISLFTINGKHVCSIILPGIVISLSYTNLPEGRHVNAIAAATSDGRLTIMSSWNLQIVWNIKIPFKDGLDPLISVKYTHSGKELFVLHKSGHVKVIQSNKSKSTFKQSLYFWL